MLFGKGTPNKEETSELEPIIEVLKEKFPNGHEDFIPMTLEEMELHSKKNFDYASGGDPLGNFNRVSAFLKQYDPLPMSPAVVAMIYAMKQVDAFFWSEHRGVEGKIEDSGKRLADVSVYSKLAIILKKEQKFKPIPPTTSP